MRRSRGPPRCQGAGRKLREILCTPKKTDVVEVTRAFLCTDTLDLNALQSELHEAAALHPFTKKSFGGWTSIPLHSVGGEIGEDASAANGKHASRDASIFAATSVATVCPTIMQLTERVARVGEGLLKVRLMKLEPGAHIGEHRDFFGCTSSGSDGGSGIQRFHIPIITHPNVQFWVNREKYFLEPGKLYAVDVSQRHSVLNRSDDVRVHLVFDVASTDRVQQLITSVAVEKI